MTKYIHSALLGTAGGLLVAGCTAAEVVETKANVLDALAESASAVAADPTAVATPAGLTILGATFVLGFFSRQSASVAKWVASTTGGPLVKGLRKILPAKKPPQE